MGTASANIAQHGIGGRTRLWPLSTQRHTWKEDNSCARSRIPGWLRSPRRVEKGGRVDREALLWWFVVFYWWLDAGIHSISPSLGMDGVIIEKYLSAHALWMGIHKPSPSASTVPQRCDGDPQIRRVWKITQNSPTATAEICIHPAGRKCPAMYLVHKTTSRCTSSYW
jgi:hypothetical protein